MVEGSQTSATRPASTRENANGSTQTAESIEKKMASLSYSFSQNMPAPRKKKSPFERNFPELGGSDKPNGLNLDSQNRLQSGAKDSEPRSSNLRLNSGPAPGQKTAAERVSSTPTRSATAAEVVAYRRKPTSAPVPSCGRKSELELFSKLVPTTSAVPRSSKLSGVNSNLGKFPESPKNAQSNRLKPGNLGNPTHSLGSGGMVVLGSNANDGRKGSRGLMKLRPTSSNTISSSLNALRKSEKDVGLVNKSEQRPTGAVGAPERSPEPPNSHPPQESEVVVEPVLEKGPPQESNPVAAEDSSFGVRPLFNYPIGSAFQFRDQVESLKRQQSSRAESVSFASDPHFGDRFGSEGQKDDSPPVDMSAFSSSASSPLYMPSARTAGEESVPEGVEVDGDVDESVLPPLPNADDHHEFESVLRQMGWTPEEEDDDRGHGNQESEKQKWLRSFGASSSSARNSSGAREPHQLYIK
eukprot:CAMPEP_0184752630 /NCGR_PEP_ID=MMETSP0315-20130426/43679_1 /TAXON_ID=101924 /ORGANISM="Rhodosorus marinus, Strain UTEX LB 2760" /LENGTH=468 /DNA_ID=CAMNT_0027231971 /DNA_START=316 /DNA_END=1722 /DNA_ORIENTATION=-